MTNKELIETCRNAMDQALSDIKWIQSVSPKTNLRSSKLLLEHALEEILRSQKHYHVASYEDGILADKCAECGRNFRDPIHHRSGLT